MQRGPDLAMARDRRFESTFLQRRVLCEPASSRKTLTGVSPMPWSARQVRTRRSNNVDLRSRGETADWAAAEPTGSREADASRMEEHHLPDRRGGQMPALWQEVQAQTAPLSPKGRLAIVHGSRHSVQNDRPHVVIAAVLEAMCEARADR
jgi:hypothetical protein